MDDDYLMQIVPGTIKQGYLTKSPPLPKGKMKQWKKRFFILYRNNEKVFFQYYDSYDSAMTSVPIDVVALNECQGVDSSVVLKSHKYLFSVQLPQRTYYLSAPSDKDMQAWVDSFRGALGIDRSPPARKIASLPRPLPPVPTASLCPASSLSLPSPRTAFERTTSAADQITRPHCDQKRPLPVEPPTQIRSSPNSARRSGDQTLPSHDQTRPSHDQTRSSHDQTRSSHDQTSELSDHTYTTLAQSLASLDQPLLQFNQTTSSHDKTRPQSDILYTMPNRKHPRKDQTCLSGDRPRPQNGSPQTPVPAVRTKIGNRPSTQPTALPVQERKVSQECTPMQQDCPEDDGYGYGDDEDDESLYVAVNVDDDEEDDSDVGAVEMMDNSSEEIYEAMTCS